MAASLLLTLFLYSIENRPSHFPAINAITPAPIPLFGPALISGLAPGPISNAAPAPISAL